MKAPTTTFEVDRLQGEALREHFLTLLFAMHRYRTEVGDPASLQRFHAEHKMLLYSHSPVHYRAAGRVAAAAGSQPWENAAEAYRNLLFRTLSERPTVGRRINALQHIMGFFKSRLTPDEKRNLLDAFDGFRAGRAPFAAPLGLLASLADRFEIEYIADQRIFTPFPPALATGGYP